MQPQIQVPKQQPGASRKQRLFVILILMLVVCATLVLLYSQGIITNAWLAALLRIVLGALTLVIVLALFWLLNKFGIFRSSWARYLRTLIHRDAGQILLLLALCLFLIFTSIGVISTLRTIKGNWWEVGNLNALLQSVYPGLGIILAFLAVYVVVYPPKQSASSSQSPADSSTPPISPPPTPPPSAAVLSPAPARSLVTLPSPPTEPGTIQQRKKIVEDIYTQLTSPDKTAIVLTGMGGIGKSTLAALVFRFEESQREAGKSFFLGEPLWLTITESVTITELASTLLEALDKPVPQIESLPPRQQAIALFNALSATDVPRLIVLDQFEALLSSSTGQVLPEHPGIGEWLGALNSRPARCRIILTSRLWPRGTSEYAPTRMQEYAIERLATAEGIELLHKQGVAPDQATEAELWIAVERWQGHPLSLTLLASILRSNRNLTMSVLLNDPFYTQLWRERIAAGMLDYIYKQQLNDVQRKLLRAFSVYREPVPVQAALAILTESSQEVIESWEVLRNQHLLQDAGALRYQLHAIVVDYARSHFDESSEQANLLARQETHAKAAEYYLLAAKNCPPRGKRSGVKDVQPLIEAIWQLCQAGRWKEAFDLMNRQYIFDDINHWGGNVILLELCRLFLPQEKWHPKRLDEALIYSRIANIYDALGQKQEALRYYQMALVIFREQGDDNGLISTLTNLGRVYDDLDQKQEALRYLEALVIRREEGNTLTNL